MLNYEEFKNEIRNNLIPSMGEKYSNCIFEEMEVNKTGKIKDGFGVRKPKGSDKKEKVMPTLYFDDLYCDYLNGEKFDDILKSVSKAMIKGIKDGKHFVKLVTDEKGPDKIVFQLVNTNDYESLLSDVPHRSFLDLSIIYRWAVDVSEDGFASALIDYNMASQYKLDEETLYERAIIDTKELFPPQVISLDEILFNMILRTGATANDANKIISKIGQDKKMYIITNKCGNIGASVLLYKDVFDSIAKKFDSDLYVLPLSTAEVMAVPVNYNQDFNEVVDLFIKLRKVKVNDEENLSDIIYHFDAKTSEMTCYSSINQWEEI